MKKLLALSVAALISTAASANTSQTVYITGEVYDQTCLFDGAALNLVPLPKIKLADLQNNADNLTEFGIKLKNCDTKSTESVLVTFDIASPNLTDDGYLKNTNTTDNKSTGVQLKITTTDNTRINLKNADEAKSEARLQRRLTNGATEFKFKAGYAKVTGENATTGLVGSSIPVKIAYQ